MRRAVGMIFTGHSARLSFVTFALVTFLLCRGAHLHAQGEAALASLTGIVQDSSGAVIPGAVVTLSSSEKGYKRQFTSDSSGRYTFSLVPPGTYDLKVTHTGFRTYEQTGIVLTVGQIASQNVTLTLGRIAQAVTVHGVSSALNTANANVATDLGEQQVTQLPLDYRSPYFLVTVNSNTSRAMAWQTFNAGGEVSGPGADQDAGAFVMSGSRYGYVGFLLDGHWNASADWDAIMYGPTVDETQEAKIQQNVFTAQYGWSMGQVINVITKSGTSKLHGDGFEFLRNNVFDANNWFNDLAGLPLPHFERNQFGGTLGGPIYIPHLVEQRDKLFFFASYEGLRQGTPLTLDTTIPTSAFRQGDFSAMLGPRIGTDALGRPIFQGQIYNPFTTRPITAGQVDSVTGLVANQTGYIRDPFQGNIIPQSLWDPVATAAAAYYPTPTGPGLANNFTSSVTVPTSQDKYTGRVDYNISDKSRFFARWSQTFEFKGRSGDFYGPSDPAGQGERAPNDRWDLGLGYTYTFSPTFLMSVNAGVNRWVEGRVEQGYPFAPSKLGLPVFFDTLSDQFPCFTISGFWQLGSNGCAAQNYSFRNTGSVFLDFTKVHDAHTFTFGYTYIETPNNGRTANLGTFNFPQNMTEGPDPTAANPATGSGFASFLLGTGNSGGFPLNANPAYMEKRHGWYLQDQWKMSRNLTTTIGLRYEIQSAPTERFNRLSYFNYSGMNPIQNELAANFGGTSPIATPGYLVFTSPGIRGLYDMKYNNFAPRASLAYQVTHKMVVRAGFGIFFVQDFPLFYVPFQGFSQTTPFVGTVNGITPMNLLNNPFPNGLITPPGRSLGPLTDIGLGLEAVGRNRSTPYVNQWMMGLQYAFTPNDSLDFSYVGNHGVKLDYAYYESDQLNPKYLSLGNQLLQPVANPFYGLITSSSCGLNQPTVPRGQLLRPFPEYCSVFTEEPLGGSSWYDGVTTEYTHRFNHGIYFLVSYTVSKFLDNTMGDQDWISGATSGIRNVYNLGAEKALDANDIPQSLALSYIAELPVGSGRHFGASMNRVENAVLGGWQVSGLTTFKSGMPLGITTSTNNTNTYGNSQRPNLVGNPNALPTGVDRHYEWFNIAAFAQPPAFTFGNVGRALPSTRGPGLNDWDIGIQKYFQPTERFRLQFRAEFFNAFNHPNFYQPDTNLGDASFGALNTAFPGRDIQFALKLLF